MPRTYKRQLGARKYADYSEESLQAALTDIVEGRLSLRKAEERHGIPRATLYRKYKGINIMKPGRQPILTSEEEKFVVTAIDRAANWGYPFTHIEVRQMVKTFLDQKGVRIPRLMENLPGTDWMRSFLQRNPELTVRISQNVKVARSEVKSPQINQYFDHLEESFADVHPDFIVNYDETNLTDDPGQVKVVVRRGEKRAQRIMDHTKSSTSVMFAATASGTVLPPYIVYKATNLYPEWLQDGPDKCVFNRSKTGWFDSIIFEDWFFKIALPHFRHHAGKKALEGDNLASHLSTKIIQAFETHNIQFSFLSPNSTHLTQPLDVSFFKPLKASWRKVLGSWKTKHRGCIPKTEFPKLLNECLKVVINKRTIINGFRATGIYPCDRLQVLRRMPDFIDPDRDMDNMKAAFDQVIQNHIITKETPKIPRRKKISVPAGKGIQVDDFTAVVPEPEDDNADEDEVSSSPTLSETEEEQEEGESFSREVKPENLKEGLFISVILTYDEGCKKEQSKFFVAKIEAVKKSKFQVSCMRQYRESKNTFVFPNIEDKATIELKQIQKILGTPTIRRGLHVFKPHPI